MAYPDTVSESADQGTSVDVTFRPVRPGLVKVIVTAVGLQPPPPDGNGGDGGGSNKPIPYTVAMTVDILKPGVAAPVATRTDTIKIQPPKTALYDLIVFLDTPATDADLGADWTARVTNHGQSRANYTISPRFQTVDGNLGKIDHIVVVMMENRSFDHMLGYLKLEGVVPDVDGLTGTESNPDPAGRTVTVFPIATDGRQVATYFANDPGHGWPDVAEQLEVDPQTKQTNSGFVKNFAHQLAGQEQNLPPQYGSVTDSGQIQGQDSRLITFRPLFPGRIGVHSVPSSHPPNSETGLLAQLTLRRPGLTTPLATTKAKLSDPYVDLSYDATDADIAATTGDWTCEITNWTNTPLTFTTNAGFVVAPHDLRGQEVPGAVMGYYTGAQLPTYDFLARRFVVCDRWFASIPTDTWPNRLYGLTGGTEIDTTPSGSDVTGSDPPGYSRTTVFEVLEANGIDWMLYFSDAPFSLIFKALAQDARYTQRMRLIGDLFDRARTGSLPAVTWIDPRFTDVEEGALGITTTAEDDHPAGDVSRGQAFIKQLYDALSQGPAWSKTLLLITYDEHGGFYDHVVPAGTSPTDTPSPGGPADDTPRYRRYGVRVPGFVVSPWTQPGVASHTVYDHTSLIATMLRRFCRAANGSVPSMGARTDAANDVGGELSEDAPRSSPDALAVAIAPPVTIAAAPSVVPPYQPESFGEVLRKALFGF